jgi:hypothetical protein
MPDRIVPKGLDDDALWCALRDFAFDAPDAELSFSLRLARDSSWPRSFARRVIEEYRRFLYLVQVAGHPCTPSEEVDQAWHLHLVYTRSYWDDLCDAVLGFPLHHGPTEGGAVEGARYHDQYARTFGA